jgi:ABC-2 type transport system ATP-binding protein
MISTETSELIKVTNLKLHFELNHYHSRNVRDAFVAMAQDPIDYFFKPKELFFAVNDVSFTLTKGMRLGILGVNGSGKTTLCRCLAGMMRAQQGSIKTNAEVRAIFDTGTGIMPELTGRENAYLLARLFFPEIKDIHPFVEEAIAFSELGHFIDIPFNKYSKGMQSRLALALISSCPTDVLILDEVFDGADVFFQEKLSKRMIQFIESAGATVFISHSMDQVRRICNQIMVLEAGKKTFFGEMEEGIAYYLNSKKEGP